MQFEYFDHTASKSDGGSPVQHELGKGVSKVSLERQIQLDIEAVGEITVPGCAPTFILNWNR